MAKKEKQPLNSVDKATKRSVRARKELTEYFKENKLDPEKDWTKHKKHGEKVSAWLKIIKLGEGKAEKVIAEKALKKKLSKPDVHPKVKEITKAPTSYDYPEIDGMPLSPEQKKKYRAKIRSLAKARKDPKESAKIATEYVKSLGQLPIEKTKAEKRKERAEKKEVKETPKSDVKSPKEEKKLKEKKDKLKFKKKKRVD